MKKASQFRDSELDLCEYFFSQSIEIWDAMEFAKKQNIRLSETTITQLMVFNFWSLAKHHSLPIKIYEANNEKANGNDLEFLVETLQGYLLLAVQAKVIKPNGKYSTINHMINGGQQIDSLLQYASKRKGLASYMFYNHLDDFNLISHIEEATETRIETWGCTVANALFLKKQYYIRNGINKWAIPSFASLHPNNAIPFYLPMCQLLNDTTKAIQPLLWHIGYELDQEPKYYTYEELKKDPDWKNLLPPGRIGYITKAEKEKISIKENPDNLGFNPKYRIILSRERQKIGGIYRVS